MNADSMLLVLTTVANAEAGGALAAALVEERLAACVNVLPVRSTYRWQGRIEVDEEQLLLIKTTRERWPRLQARIGELHAYDVPEVVALGVADVEARYLDWLLDGCADPD